MFFGARNQLVNCENEVDRLKEEIADLESENERLREYVAHKPSCNLALGDFITTSGMPDCTCGLDALLEEGGE